MHVRYMIERESSAPRQPVSGSSAIALAVSDWDGVHRGHVALARETAALAARHGARAVALLPWPSPAGGDNEPGVRLTTLEERIALLGALGCFDTLVVAPAPAEAPQADAALAALRRLGDVRAVVVEAQRGAVVERVCPTGLADAAREAGISFAEAHSAGQTSEQIRALVEAGSMRQATAALGYTYTVTGDVIGGDRRGRLLGFPTANLRLEPSKLAPGNGIYAALAILPGDDTRWPAAVSIGVRPTFGQDGRRLIEAHLLDATMDLYGVRLELRFVEWLRAELRFESVEALIEQMNNDRERTRAVLQAESDSQRRASVSDESA